MDDARSVAHVRHPGFRSFSHGSVCPHGSLLPRNGRIRRCAVPLLHRRLRVRARDRRFCGDSRRSVADRNRADRRRGTLHAAS